MLVTFLDIDGVLNSRDWWLRRPPHTEEGESLSDAERRYRWARRNLDPAAIARLQRIVDATKTCVVLSSSWRTMTKLHEMTYYLRHFGGEGTTLRLLGSTPDLRHGSYPDTAGGGVKRSLLDGDTRGFEIRTWLDLIPTRDIESYVVLDDDNIDQHDDHFVRTDPDDGLADADADRAIAILNTQRIPVYGSRDEGSWFDSTITCGRCNSACRVTAMISRAPLSTSRTSE